jgi:hypothetical protein
MGRPPKNPGMTDREAGNLLIDFCTWMSTQPGTVRVGARHEVVPLIDSLKRWAELRGIDLSQSLALQMAGRIKR